MFLMRSIDEPVVSFAGAFPGGFTTQWNPWGASGAVYHYVGGQPFVPIGHPFVYRWSTPTMAHTIRVNTTQETATAEVEEFYVRACCHWLIDQLPVRALPELVSSLIQLREFYALAPSSESATTTPQKPLSKVTRL